MHRIQVIGAEIVAEHVNTMWDLVTNAEFVSTNTVTARIFELLRVWRSRLLSEVPVRNLYLKAVVDARN